MNNIYEQLSTDTCRIDFGTTVIGETLKRTFTLTNKGALGTKFEFFKVTGQKERTVTTAATSLGGLVSCREEIKGENKHRILTLNTYRFGTTLSIFLKVPGTYM